MNRLITLCLLFLFSFSSCGSSKKVLHIYIWGDFIKQEIIERFEKEYNCKVVIDTYDSNESMYAKLKSGASGYDLIFPTGYILQVMENQGMLHPMDKALIPNMKNLDFTILEQLKETPHENSIPYAITYTALAYRKDKVKMQDPSWNVFARTDLKGRMTMLNDMREVMGVALLFNGFSINTINKNEIDAAVKDAIRWKKNLAKFESEQYKNGIASAEYLVVQGYSSDIMQLESEESNVALSLPVEGGIFSCDYVTIPKGAVKLELAHAFINFILRSEIAAENMEANFYLSPNKPAFELLSASLRENPALFPPDSFIEMSESLQDLGEHTKLYINAWEAIKAS